MTAIPKPRPDGIVRFGKRKAKRDDCMPFAVPGAWHKPGPAATRLTGIRTSHGAKQA